MNRKDLLEELQKHLDLALEYDTTCVFMSVSAVAECVNILKEDLGETNIEH